jgi:transcription initiation factor TFIIIB Brf1 subunit/transcription initiation factor TFIIB
MEEKDQVEDEEEAEKKRKVKKLRLIEEEMRRMVEDDAELALELALEELQVL